jgi:predicted metal-dependent peptidase
VYLLAHEVGHEVFDHLNRRGSRDHMRWNYAGDAVINDLLNECKVGTPIPGGVDMAGSRKETTDAIYNKLPEMEDMGGGIGDDIDDSGGPMSESDINEATARVKMELAQAAQVAKMAGKLPGVLEEMVADILAVKTPWYEILEKHMVSFVRSDYTWARPNRRFIGQGSYLPSTGRKQTMGGVVVQVDVSGSISKVELDYYNGHISRIIEMCQPETVDIIYTDTSVQKHMHFEQGEEVSLQFYSGGCTHMPAGFDWVAKEGLAPEVFVCLTDGGTDFGSDPGYPVVWCISSDVQAPWGTNVHFEMEKN